jgi:tRNA(adenine34) deaminase
MDEFYMQRALNQARMGASEGEVPVGAVIVFKDAIIAEAHNEVEKRKDAAAHAEILCLQKAAQKLGNWRLQEAVLYCTLEPCTMCAGAFFLYRLKRVVWGARDLRHGAHGSWIDVRQEAHPTHELEVLCGVLEEPSADLMRTFFQERRKENLCVSSK